MAAARSFLVDVAIRCVFPVLQITSCLLIMAMIGDGKRAFTQIDLTEGSTN